MPVHGSHWIQDSLVDTLEPRPVVRESEARVQRATLDGIPGAAVIRSRRRDESRRDWRVTFVFATEHEGAIAALDEGSGQTVLEGFIEGRPRKLDVTLTAFALGAGIAFLESNSEPY